MFVFCFSRFSLNTRFPQLVLVNDQMTWDQTFQCLMYVLLTRNLYLQEWSLRLKFIDAWSLFCDDVEMSISSVTLGRTFTLIVNRNCSKSTVREQKSLQGTRSCDPARLKMSQSSASKFWFGSQLWQELLPNKLSARFAMHLHQHVFILPH